MKYWNLGAIVWRKSHSLVQPSPWVNHWSRKSLRGFDCAGKWDKVWWISWQRAWRVKPRWRLTRFSRVWVCCSVLTAQILWYHTGTCRQSTDMFLLLSCVTIRLSQCWRNYFISSVKSSNILIQVISYFIFCLVLDFWPHRRNFDRPTAQAVTK